MFERELPAGRGDLAAPRVPDRHRHAGIVVAILGAVFAWLVWYVIRIALFTILGALVGAAVLGLWRSNLWFVGALAGAAIGFFAGYHMHKRALVLKKLSPPPPKP